jgi:hypothetical protein
MDLLILVDPAEISNIDNPKITHDTPRPRRTKKTKEVQELYSEFVKTASISSEKGSDGKELDAKEVEQKQGDEVDPLKKRKGSPLKPSSRNKEKVTMTKMQTVLTSDDFDFFIASL